VPATTPPTTTPPTTTPPTTPTSFAQPIVATDEQLAQVTYNADGLVPAVVQDATTREVLMLAWVTAETLRLTLAEGRTVFWSRSRQEVWRKGETSGDVQYVRSAHYDCDGDVLLFVVDQQGAGACHTGERSCFFRAFGSGSGAAAVRQATDPVAGIGRAS
jgi:phosphoribosyl-AMP cyclohydrolase/phosphoribosyl-ATP pyrophosphohydrolase/phosphoribosyl-AMP cyclohydrolase